MRIHLLLAAIFTFLAPLSASAQLIYWPPGAQWPSGVPSIKLGEDYYYEQPNDGKTPSNMTAQQCTAYYVKMRADFLAALAALCGPGRDPYDQRVVNGLAEQNSVLTDFEEELCKQIANRFAPKRILKGKNVPAMTPPKTGASFSQPAISGPGLLESDQNVTRQAPGATGNAPVAAPAFRSR
jgi:hypothetical protein